MPKTITVTREQLEELRGLAFTAVDAAYMAGRKANDSVFFRNKAANEHDQAANKLGAWFDERELELRGTTPTGA